MLIFITSGSALAEEVTITATIAQETASTITYDIAITEINFDIISFNIAYNKNILQITGVNAGPKITSSDITSNLGSGRVLIDLPGTDGQTISGNIATASFNILGQGNKDIGVSNVDIATGIGSGVTIDNIEEDELEEDDELEKGRKFITSTFTPDDNTNQNQQQNQQTPSNNNQQQSPNNNNNDEEPKDDNSILIYSLIAVGAIILIVGGFVAWNKFKKPKDELPIHETTPLQQPDQSQQPQPAPDQPTTDQKPDQPTQ